VYGFLSIHLSFFYLSCVTNFAGADLQSVPFSSEQAHSYVINVKAIERQQFNMSCKNVVLSTKVLGL